MSRILVTLSLLGVFVFGALSFAPPAFAATVTFYDLRSASLSTDQLVGYRLVAEDSPDGEGIMQATFGRILVKLTADKQVSSRVGILLLAPESFVSQADLESLTTSGELHQGVSDDPSFHFLAPLGVGELDQAATWNDFDSRSNTWHTYYADTFLRGRMVTHIVYEAPSDQSDTCVLAHIARLQDEKLQHSSVLALLSAD